MTGYRWQFRERMVECFAIPPIAKCAMDWEQLWQVRDGHRQSSSGMKAFKALAEAVKSAYA